MTAAASVDDDDEDDAPAEEVEAAAAAERLEDVAPRPPDAPAEVDGSSGCDRRAWRSTSCCLSGRKDGQSCIPILFI